VARHNISERWVRDIEEEAREFENFETNTQWRETVVEIFDDTYEAGDLAVVEELGNTCMEIVEGNRHPKSSRVRRVARSLLDEHGYDIPVSGVLRKSSVG